MSADQNRSVVLAAGTVDGSGTMVALASALLNLAEVSATRPVTAIVPSKGIELVGDNTIEYRPTSRRQAIVDEALGRPTADVYIGFADRLPLRPNRSTDYVMVVQNPHLYGPPDEWAHANRAKHAVLSRWARHSAKRADLVICSTAASRVDVIASAAVDPDRVVVRPIPARPVEQTKSDHRDVVQRVLNVGDLYNYKRADVALDAVIQLAEAEQRPLEFVHVGRSVDETAERALDAAANRAKASGVTVTRLGGIAHDEVFAQMIESDVIILPSAAESQGVPLVEALSVGLPVICRNSAVFAEQGAEHVIAVGSSEPTDRRADVGAFAEGLAAVADPEVRKRLSRGGLNAHQQTLSGWDLLPEG